MCDFAVEILCSLSWTFSEGKSTKSATNGRKQHARNWLDYHYFGQLYFYIWLCQTYDMILYPAGMVRVNSAGHLFCFEAVYTRLDMHLYDPYLLEMLHAMGTRTFPDLLTYPQTCLDPRRREFPSIINSQGA